MFEFGVVRLQRKIADSPLSLQGIARPRWSCRGTIGVLPRVPGPLAAADHLGMYAAECALLAQSEGERRSDEGASLGLGVMQSVRNRTSGVRGHRPQGRRGARAKFPISA